MSKSSFSVQQIASQFRLFGWVNFWVQLVLSVISAAILLFASVTNRVPNSTNAPTTGIGAVLTIGGILVLGFTMYWSLTKYVRLGRLLKGSPAARPKKSETVQALRTGLYASLGGMLLAIIGAFAIVGLLATKAFTQGSGVGLVNDPSKFIQPLDVLVVQSSINVILAQFVGIATSLWLLNSMSRQ